MRADTGDTRIGRAIASSTAAHGSGEGAGRASRAAFARRSKCVGYSSRLCER